MKNYDEKSTKKIKCYFYFTTQNVLQFLTNKKRKLINNFYNLHKLDYTIENQLKKS